MKRTKKLFLHGMFLFCLCLLPLLSGCSKEQSAAKDAGQSSEHDNKVSAQPSADSTFEGLPPSALQTSLSDSETGSKAQDDSSESSHAVSFQDALGREVSIAKPKRVAALIGSFADIWCLAGGKDSLVAAAHDTWTNFDLKLDDSVVDLGLIKEPNLELLAASEPDFIIASSNTDADVKMLDTLEAMGMNVAYFQVSNFEEYLNMLDLCTQITGCRENYEEYGQKLQQQILDACAAANGSSPTVLYLRASSSSCKAKNSKGSVLGEMLSDLGCINLADNEKNLLEDLSIEAILTADPQYIFVVLQGADKSVSMEMLKNSLLSNPAWESLSAVKEGRFHILDEKLYNLKPNARWGEAYEELAKLLYPEAFPK